MSIEVESPTLSLDYTRNGRAGSITVTAKIGADVLAAESLDVLKPKSRDAFAARLCDGRAGIDRTAVDAELLRIAVSVAERPQEHPTGAAEIELSSVVRPELFHHHDVSGITVPIPGAMGTEVRARWFTYLRWADGRRERIELQPAIELADGSRLWVHPTPGDPSPTMRSNWSAKARTAWLAGEYQTPNAADVFKRICERIAHYLEFPPESRTGATATLALWSMFTYCFAAWRSVPYLNVGGPLGSGKTTVFKVLGRIVFRPLASSNMTAPCLFRTLHECGGTLLLDEAERLREGSPEAGELRSVLLAGYAHGTPAMRLEKQGDGFARVSFDVFGPKALAGIASLPEALASRCIRMTMFRAGPDSPKPRRRISDDIAWAGIRDDLHALALEHGADWLDLARRSDVAPQALAARDYELWQPLLALAAFVDDAGASGLLGAMQAYALATTTEAVDEATPVADEVFLRLLAQRVHLGTQDETQSADLLRAARAEDSTTFEKWSPQGVAAVLRKYGIKAKKKMTGRTFELVTADQIKRIEKSYGMELLPPGQAP